MKMPLHNQMNTKPRPAGPFLRNGRLHVGRKGYFKGSIVKQIDISTKKYPNIFALVDDEDYEYLNQWKWGAKKEPTGDFYVKRNSSRKKGKQHQIFMHREILGLEYGDKRQCDHINHNTSDNRQTNLRICTRRQNIHNQRSCKKATSRFKGVSFCKERGLWRACIQNGKNQ